MRRSTCNSVRTNKPFRSLSVEQLEPRLVFANLVATAFSGPNLAFNSKPGEIGGGYFFIDYDLRPTAGTAHHQTYARWDAYDLGGALIDASLATDTTADGTIDARIRPIPITDINHYGYAENVDFPTGKQSSGFLRFSYDTFLNVYYDPGPELFYDTINDGTPTLGEYFGPLQLRGINGAQILGASDSWPVVALDTITERTFTAEDVFNDPATKNSLIPCTTDSSIEECTFGAGNIITPEPGEIFVLFRPSIKLGDYEIPVSLNHLAMLYGVDHFNWLQTIRESPDVLVYVDKNADIDGKVELSPLDFRCGARARGYLDPIACPPAAYHLINMSSEMRNRPYPQGHGIVYAANFSDDYPYYWSEDGVEGNVGKATNWNSLGFSDQPHRTFLFDFPTTILYDATRRRYYAEPRPPLDWDPPSVTHFTTELVGVMKDEKNSFIRTGLKFEWDSNLRTDITEGQWINWGNTLPAGTAVITRNDVLPTTWGKVSNVSISSDESRLRVLESQASSEVVEGGETCSYRLVLSERPNSDVTVRISPDSQLTTDVQVITFTADNWSTPQTVTIMANDDDIGQGRRVRSLSHSLESADVRFNVVGVRPVEIIVLDNDWQNSRIAKDVSDDGAISPVDALLVINYVNSHTTSSLPPVPNQPAPFYDVNGDGFISPVDALIVINYLNDAADAEPGDEGAFSGSSNQNGPASDAIWSVEGLSQLASEFTYELCPRFRRRS